MAYFLIAQLATTTPQKFRICGTDSGAMSERSMFYRTVLSSADSAVCADSAGVTTRPIFCRIFAKVADSDDSAKIDCAAATESMATPVCPMSNRLCVSDAMTLVALCAPADADDSAGLTMRPIFDSTNVKVAVSDDSAG